MVGHISGQPNFNLEKKTTKLLFNFGKNKSVSKVEHVWTKLLFVKFLITDHYFQSCYLRHLSKHESLSFVASVFSQFLPSVLVPTWAKCLTNYCIYIDQVELFSSSWECFFLIFSWEEKKGSMIILTYFEIKEQKK